jgi:stage II sporulation protein D
MTRRTVAMLVAIAACTSVAPSGGAPGVVATQPSASAAPASRSRPVQDAGDATIRVLLSTSRNPPSVGSSGGLILTDVGGNLISRGERNAVWRFEHEGRRVRAIRPDGVGTVWTNPPMLVRAMNGALLTVGTAPFRGDLAVYGTDTGVVVVNVVKIDDYLRGVVPLEIGTRSEADSAAVQAQAVTARSYAFIHLSNDASRMYDVTAGELDQVYKGVAAESPVASQAVESTRTLVLKYAGRVVNAPYHSTCGGSTASASEVWRSADEPYLHPVSDRIPGTNRYYCDIAPRFQWTKTLDGPTLNAALAQYLANYAKVPNRAPGTAKDVAVASRTPSGRVGTLTVTTDRGNFVLRGNDTRYVLRAPGGELLNSTNFSVEASHAADGSVSRLVIRGTGYGHGIGMCQWGAIGRARAGQDFRTILRSYYPGTTVGSAE